MISYDQMYFDEYSKMNDEDLRKLDQLLREEVQGVEVQQFERFEGNRKQRRMQASFARRVKGKIVNGS